MAEPPVSSKIEHLDIVIDATIRAGEKIVQTMRVILRWKKRMIILR